MIFLGNPVTERKQKRFSFVGYTNYSAVEFKLSCLGFGPSAPFWHRMSTERHKLQRFWRQKRVKRDTTPCDQGLHIKLATSIASRLRVLVKVKTSTFCESMACTATAINLLAITKVCWVMVYADNQQHRLASYNYVFERQMYALI